MTHNSPTDVPAAPYTFVNPYTESPVMVYRSLDLATTERRSIVDHAAGKPGHGDSVRWVRQIRGITYTFSLVTMPTGEIRINVSAFNGYAGGMQFGCAWTPVRKMTIAPPTPVLGQKVWYTPANGPQRAGRVILFGSIIDNEQLFYVIYKDDAGTDRTVYTNARAVSPRVTHIRHTFTPYVLDDPRQGCAQCGEGKHWDSHYRSAKMSGDIRDQIAADADAILTGAAGCNKCTEPKPHTHTGYHGMPIYATQTVCITLETETGRRHYMTATYRQNDGLIRATYKTPGRPVTQSTVTPWFPDWEIACRTLGLDPNGMQTGA